ncbi:hypothetical protein ACFQ2B_26730 [Streptomyces stramineus]
MVFALPGLWVAAVLAWELLGPRGTQVIPLLAAAPAIACAGTGRRRCVTLAGVCAVLALVPPPSAGRADTAARLGTCCAVVAVAAAGHCVSGRGAASPRAGAHPGDRGRRPAGAAAAAAAPA